MAPRKRSFEEFQASEALLSLRKFIPSTSKEGEFHQILRKTEKGDISLNEFIYITDVITDVEVLAKRNLTILDVLKTIVE